VIAPDDHAINVNSLFEMTEPIISDQSDLVIGRRREIILPPQKTMAERIKLEFTVNTEFLLNVFKNDEVMATTHALDLQSGLVAWRQNMDIPWHKVQNNWLWSAYLWKLAYQANHRISEVDVCINLDAGSSRTSLQGWKQHYQKLGYLDPRTAETTRLLAKKIYSQYL
jgi:hypothetical protein